MNQSMSLTQGMRQSQVLAPQMRQGLAMLQMTSLDLRAELQRQMALNPAIEDVTSRQERVMTAELPDEHQSGAISERELDFTPTGEVAQQTLSCDDADRDYFLQNMENFSGGGDTGAVDPDAQTRRQVMFDRQVRPETLQEHLQKQLRLVDLSDSDHALGELLIESIDDDGWFRGAVPDVQMVTGSSEADVLRMLKTISTLDPLGCGARDLRECLLFQMEKLDDSPWEDEIRALVDRHLEDIANRREALICQDLNLARDDYHRALAELRRSLDPKPGRGFLPRSDVSLYVKPEVFLTKNKQGRWTVHVPDRDIPEIHISRRFVAMLQDPKCSADTKKYVRERIQAAETLIESLEKRQDTIHDIAQTIVDAQTAVFDNKSLASLRPLTMDQVAEKVGVHPATVSRAVNGKYMSTPLGTVELRKFFATGLKTADGEVVANAAVKDRIRQLIAAEDKMKPLSDGALSTLLKQEGVSCARRTVAKYREAIGIPTCEDRRIK